MAKAKAGLCNQPAQQSSAAAQGGGPRADEMVSCTRAFGSEGDADPMCLPRGEAKGEGDKAKLACSSSTTNPPRPTLDLFACAKESWVV